MLRIKLVNEVGNKKAILAGIVMVCFLMTILMIMIWLNPKSANLVGVIGTITLTGITAIVLFLTLQTYAALLTVSEQNLSFTKNQTSYNSFFDNYKLFYELSKLKTDKVYDQEVFDKPYYFFDSLTFSSIHFNYMHILEEFPKPSNKDILVRYEIVFKRFNYKIQSLVDILFDEIVKIKDDNNLRLNQKVALINLYKNFVINDYLSLCKDLIQNKEWFDSDILPPTEITNLIKCNTNDRTIFNIDAFLKLYYEIEKQYE